MGRKEMKSNSNWAEQSRHEKVNVQKLKVIEKGERSIGRKS